MAAQGALDVVATQDWAVIHVIIANTLYFCLFVCFKESSAVPQAEI